MDQAQFLDRVIPPGNFLCVSAKPARGGFRNHFFERSNIAAAQEFLRRAVEQGMDAYHALASFVETGDRRQVNAQALKCFWIDADVKREGDGKDPSKCFPTALAAAGWVKGFCRKTGIPVPNLWVKSGHGLHIYWVLEEALDRAAWKPYAEAFKAAVIAHGFTGDTGVIANEAGVLRPVETFNFKVPESPAPCRELSDLSGPDYPNEQLLGAIAALPQAKKAEGGRPSSKFAEQLRSMTANARSGITVRPHNFGLIAERCGQVNRSVAEHGAGDGRQLWHFMVMLAWFCDNGRDWAHAVGSAHAKYSIDDTDREFDQVGEEHAKKNFGAPLCKSFAGERSGICDTCPFKDTVETPYTLGVDETDRPDSADLPVGYRRNEGQLERFQKSKSKKGTGAWLHLVYGDVQNPRIEWVGAIGDHLRLTFDYISHHGIRPVVVENLKIETRNAKQVFTEQGVPLTLDNALPFARFIMAWIELLHRNTDNIPLASAAPHFGWHIEEGGKIFGLSVAGDCYLTDGTEQRISGGDVNLIKLYQPRGSFEKWQEATEVIGENRPDLQIAIAVAFGSPLMTFTGESGACISFIGASGQGKSSSFKAGASAYGHPKNTSAQLKDTENFISHRIGAVRCLPIYWDEVQISDRWKANELKDLLHKLTQGRDKGRLTADIQDREMGDWQSLFPFASNDSVTAALAGLGGDNSATLLRVLEITVDAGAPIRPNMAVNDLVQSLEYNYGHAGRTYIKYLAEHVDAVTAIVRKFKLHLIDKIRASNEERFYIAAGAAVLAGAFLAHKLKLVRNFDVAAMNQIIVKAIRQSRIMRGEYAPTDPRARTHNTLVSFCNEYEGQSLVTSHFAASGFGVLHLGEKFILRNPLAGSRLAYHIGARDFTLRINKEIFREWCGKKGFDPEGLVRDMKAAGWVYARKDQRAYLGAGTQWRSNSRLNVVDLDLQHGDLSHFVPPAEEPAKGNVLAFRPPQ